MKPIFEYTVGELVTIEKITFAYIGDSTLMHHAHVGRIDIGDYVTLLEKPGDASRRWKALTKHGLAYIDIGSEGA